MKQNTPGKGEKDTSETTTIDHTSKVVVQKRALPLVSIIVLTYNQQFLLKDCLTSILNQNYPNLELIVCDDASADFDIEETTKLIEKLKKNNLKNYIIYKQPENVGTTKNAAKGIELSSGEIFKLHAGDDMLFSPKVISSVVRKFLHDENIRILAARSIACMPDGKLTNDKYPSDTAVKKMMDASCIEQFTLMSTQAWGEYINAPAVFWERSLYDEIGGFDARYKYTEDWPTWLIITQKGIRITSIDYVSTIYRYGGISNNSSMTNKILGKAHYQECIRMMHDIAIPVLEQEHNKDALRKCRHCIRAIEARIVCETKWENMSSLEKLLWKIKNLDFLGDDLFYKNRVNELYIETNGRPWLIAMVMCLFFYFVQGYPLLIRVTQVISLLLIVFIAFMIKGKNETAQNVFLMSFLFYFVETNHLFTPYLSRFWSLLAIGLFVVYLARKITNWVIRFHYWNIERSTQR